MPERWILLGQQLKPILARLSSEELARYATAAIAVCAAVMLVRIVGVMSYTTGARWGGTNTASAAAMVALVQHAAWVPALGAAALALPDGGNTAFPYRDFILFTAFSVVLGTLRCTGDDRRPG